MKRLLHVVAREIQTVWAEKIYFGAKPYLDAMTTLNSVSDNYGFDSGSSIVTYFLANARNFRAKMLDA